MERSSEWNLHTLAEQDHESCRQQGNAQGGSPFCYPRFDQPATTCETGWWWPQIALSAATTSSMRIVGSVSAPGTMWFNDTTPTCATHVPGDRIAS